MPASGKHTPPDNSSLLHKIYVRVIIIVMAIIIMVMIIIVMIIELVTEIRR